MPQNSLNRAATILIRIRMADGRWRYAKPVYTGNRRLKPLYAVVGGKPEHHQEGSYTLRYKGQNGNMSGSRRVLTLKRR